VVGIFANTTLAALSRRIGERRTFTICIVGVALCAMFVCLSLLPLGSGVGTRVAVGLQIAALLASNVFFAGVAMFWFSTALSAVSREHIAMGMMLFGLCFDGASVLSGSAAAAVLGLHGGVTSGTRGLSSEAAFALFLVGIAVVAWAAARMTRRFVTTVNAEG
jgi:hypothetical protein